MTDRFVRSAEIVAQVNGVPGYGFAVIAHPVANDGDDVLRAKAEAVAPTIVDLLTRRGDSPPGPRQAPRDAGPAGGAP